MWLFQIIENHSLYCSNVWAPNLMVPKLCHVRLCHVSQTPCLAVPEYRKSQQIKQQCPGTKSGGAISVPYLVMLCIRGTMSRCSRVLKIAANHCLYCSNVRAPNLLVPEKERLCSWPISLWAASSRGCRGCICIAEVVNLDFPISLTTLFLLLSKLKHC